MTDHNIVVTPGMDATCTTEGLTDGQQCSWCGMVVAAPETIPAKGHAWGKGTVTQKPTTETEGVRTFTCTVCGENRTEPIPVLDGSRIPGDANDDGMANIFDALLILQYDVGWEVELNLNNSDVNASGTVDIFDALLILQVDVGWDEELI